MLLLKLIRQRLYGSTLVDRQFHVFELHEADGHIAFEDLLEHEVPSVLRLLDVNTSLEVDGTLGLVANHFPPVGIDVQTINVIFTLELIIAVRHEGNALVVGGRHSLHVLQSRHPLD